MTSCPGPWKVIRPPYQMSTEYLLKVPAISAVLSEVVFVVQRCYNIVCTVEFETGFTPFFKPFKSCPTFNCCTSTIMASSVIRLHKQGLSAVGEIGTGNQDRRPSRRR